KTAAPSKLPQSRMTELWADLASPELFKWRRAYSALAAAPQSALQICRERIPPARQPDCSKLAGLLAGLDSNGYAERSQATETLRKTLADAEKAFMVEKALRHLVTTSPSLEARTRAERLLSDFRDPTPDPDLLRNLRAA